MIKNIALSFCIFLAACGVESEATIGMTQPVNTSPCPAGFTRSLPSFCLDSDGTLSAFRTYSGTVGEGASTTTVVNANATYVIVKAETILTHTANARDEWVAACGSIPSPGAFSCSYNAAPDNIISIVISYLGPASVQNASIMIIPADATGAINTRCNISASPPSTATCAWYIVGFADRL